MSHFVQTKLKISDQKLLIRSLRSLGYSIRTGPVTMQNQYAKSDIVDIAINGKTIGFKKVGDGYELVADFWRTGLNRVEFVNALERQYVKEQVAEICDKAGLKAGQWQEQKDGVLEMVAIKRNWG